VWRLLALVAVVILIQAHAASTVVNAGPGRDQSACVNACNVVRDACDATCESDCAILAPPIGSDAYNNCVSKCGLDCVGEMQYCKAKCNINRDVPSPTEP
jgi:hypothetical protein